jgi:hypothetical protein
MPSANDKTYYAARAEQERRMAREAADKKIAALHSELASRYAELAGEPPSMRRIQA